MRHPCWKRKKGQVISPSGKENRLPRWYDVDVVGRAGFGANSKQQFHLEGIHKCWNSALHHGYNHEFRAGNLRVCKVGKTSMNHGELPNWTRRLLGSAHGPRRGIRKLLSLEIVLDPLLAKASTLLTTNVTADEAIYRIAERIRGHL